MRYSIKKWLTALTALALVPAVSFGQFLADKYEVDNTNTLASVIVVSSNQVHTIHVAGDVDWMKFTGVAGHQYTIETSDPDGGTSTFDTIMHLYASDAATILAWNDDGGTYRFSKITFVVQTFGTYYIKAREFFGASGPLPTGKYNITLTDDGVVTGIAQLNQYKAETIDVDSEGWPVRAGIYDNYTNQLGVFRWFGPVTNALGKNGVWTELEFNTGQWRGLDGTVAFGGSWESLTMAPAVPSLPTVAVNGPVVYVAWINRETVNAVGRIYLKCWNGSEWTELGGSATGVGLGAPNLQFEKDCDSPKLAILPNGNPVVSFQQPLISVNGQNVSFVQAVCVKKFVGDVTTGAGGWVGMDGSVTGVVPGCSIAFDPDMALDPSGNPVVAWGEPAQSKILVSRWTGSSWSQISQALGASPYAEKPVVTVSRAGNIYVAFRQYYLDDFMNYDVLQVDLAQWSGSSWVGLGGSYSFPGISSARSGGADTPTSITVAMGSNNWPMVCWQAGTTNSPSVRLKEWNGSSWIGLDGSDVSPGVGGLGGLNTAPYMKSDAWGRPCVALGHGEVGRWLMQIFKITGSGRPIFSGLTTAIGSTNATITLSWGPAASMEPPESYSNITYHVYRNLTPTEIYQGPPSLTENDLFTTANIIANITVVPGASSYVYTNILPNTSAYIDKWWGFGVRAEINGIMDNNVAIHYAAASNVVPFLVLPPTDADGDGLDDRWDPSTNNADSNMNDVSDGDEYRLGITNIFAVTNLYHYLTNETFESAGWTNTGALALWHRTTVDPDSPTNLLVRGMFIHSTSRVMRCAINNPPDGPTNTYDVGIGFRASMDSLPLNPRSAGLTNLFISWNEWYETEASYDLCSVAVRTNGGKWRIARVGVSGTTPSWTHAKVDLTDWWRSVGAPDGVQIRFEFQVPSKDNNHFRGWYVDDFKMFGGGNVVGCVRDVYGAPVLGAQVLAIGYGITNGVTNSINGHLYILPGKVFGLGISDTNGNYEIKGLLQGKYYIKAVASGLACEFWNGKLYNAYGFGNGIATNAGVLDIREVKSQGLADMTQPDASLRCDFELDYGFPRGSAVVITPNASREIRLDQWQYGSPVWNGLTGAVTAATNNYYSTNATSILSFASGMPDWETNPTPPNVLSDIVEGQHFVFLPAISGIPTVSLPVRAGEVTYVIVQTNLPSGGRLSVVTEDSSYPVYVDGQPFGNSNGGQLTGLQAGNHQVTVRPVAAGLCIVAPKDVMVPTSGVSYVAFNALEIVGPGGFAQVSSTDIHGNSVTGATVFVDGLQITSQNIVPGSSVTTPALIRYLGPGTHGLVVRKAGYQDSEIRGLSIQAGMTNSMNVIIMDSDRDYDKLGDSIEVASYTNILAGSRNNSSANDGVSNYVKFEQYRIFGARMSLSTNDSDADGMTDLDEMRYDGITNYLSLSVLATNVAINSTNIEVSFRGRFLEGVNFWPSNGHMSIEGDEFRATGSDWAFAANGTPYIKYYASSAGADSEIVNLSHLMGAECFADTRPDVPDTDGDGMWDGFEYKYLGVRGMDPINKGSTTEDPDMDGLINIREFLGYLNLPSGNTNNWSNPGNPDTDGDGMPDGWELNNRLNPTDGIDGQPGADADGDGLANLQEWQNGTDPNNRDSDGDGMLDSQEVFVYGTNPNNRDTDGDGLMDGQEIWDTEGNIDRHDGGFFPNWSPYTDTDGDGLSDGPLDWDSDGDGMPDGFEVLQWNGVLRAKDRRLDPSNPLDGNIDSDSDGLSNLQEYLVRDALYGNPPPGVLYDFSSDPFNPDSDGDGMPDGWEVEHSLHPMDPLPSSEVDVGMIIRHENLWIFGDLDGDGLANLQEYTARFLVNPNANPYAIEGSCDPRNPDTDGDGLKDGEEVKAFRSNPLNQDTDGDGLRDGQSTNLTMYGEVNTIPGSTNHYDRALNDLWVCDYTRPGREMGFQAFWQLQLPDKDPVAIPVVGADAQNRIVIPVFFWPDVGGWTNVLGLGSYRWSGSANRPNVNTLTYYFYAPTNDIYEIAIYQPSGSAKEQVKLDFGDWSGDSTVVGDWGYSTPMVIYKGMHTLHIRPAKDNFPRIDRIFIYPRSVGRTIGSDSAILLTPLMPVGTWPLDRPERRWAAGSSIANYEVRDVDGNYGGQRVSGLGSTNQLLCKAKQFAVWGGREGSTWYSNSWVFKDFITWQAGSPQVGAFASSNSLSGIGEGRSDFVTSSQPGNWTPPNGYQPDARPRPGYRDSYLFYLMDSTAGPSLWDTGTNNLWRFPYVTGWDGISGLYSYYPYKNVHDRVMNFNLAYMNNLSWAYTPQEDYVQPEFRWQSDLLGYALVNTNRMGAGGLAQTNILGTVSAVGWTNYMADGALIASNYVIIGAVHIKSIINSANEYKDNAGNVVAILTLKTKRITTTAPMDIVIQSDVSLTDDQAETLMRTSGHKTYTSYLYKTNKWQSAFPTIKERFNQTGSVYDSTNRIAYTIRQLTDEEAYIDVDVTPLVHEIFMLGHNDNEFWKDPRWEIGNNIGFILTAPAWRTAADPSSEYILIADANLTIKLIKPAWSDNAETHTVTAAAVSVPFQRKSAASAVLDDYSMVLFGGLDGNRVLGDTWTLPAGALAYVQQFGLVAGITAPSARWGHSMVALPTAGNLNYAVLFGGFDSNNVPLNDLWVWNGARWYEITDFANTDSGVSYPEPKNKPRPRGGAALGIVGGHPCLFGGTDGEHYFNDTWLLEELGSVPSSSGQPWRWFMVEPVGERYNTLYTRSDYISPAPRAFASCASADGKMFVFGGRTGALPTGKDTDSDEVDDGVEHALGGPASGRDPSVNALNGASYSLNLPRFTEKIPYTYRFIGGIYGRHTADTQFVNFVATTNVIADFESLSHAHNLANGREEHYQNRWSEFPYEGKRTPSPTIHDFISRTGYDAIMADMSDLWWHPSTNAGQWAMGAPDGAYGPRYAHSGRWCFGTGLSGPYKTNGLAELYSPLFDLARPAESSATDFTNPNGYYLVFYEWLNLANVDDSVKIECVRPSSGADLANRLTGSNPMRPIVPVLASRNNSFNTTGEWRKVIVPLDMLFNETNLFLRFVMDSGNGNPGLSGGWFIDDVSILQAGGLSGTYSGWPTGTVYLIGRNGTTNDPVQVTSTDSNGVFGFTGLIPAGDYRIATPATPVPGIEVVIGTNGSWNVGITNDLSSMFIYVDITVHSPAQLTWNTAPGVTYEVQYSTPATLATANPWTVLTTITATGYSASFVDMGWLTSDARFYRIVMILPP